MNNSGINYKQKYLELKTKFMESVDTAFRLGIEQGIQQAQQDQMIQQQQQAMQMQQQQNGGFGDQNNGSPAGEEQMANPNGGQVGDMEPNPEDIGSNSDNSGGSELDKHIAELESMLGKSEQINPADLILLTNKMKNLRKNMASEMEFKKSQMAIPAIAKALHKPSFKIGRQASQNMNNNAKQAVTMQHKIVEDIMKSFKEEEEKAAKEIKNVLNIEGLVKKE